LPLSAYAADGYARIKGLSAMVTTFGVGELSAINGIAGAYSEFVPVIHIVGVPSRPTQEKGMVMHHTLGNGDFNVFKNMFSEVSVAMASLVDERTAAQLFDDALEKCWRLSRPVYVWLPSDMVKVQVEGARLKENIPLVYADNEKEKEEYCTKVILEHLTKSKSAIVLVDACAIRHRALKETEAFIKASGLPYVTSPMGKGAIDETLPSFCGIYAGDATDPETKKRVESSDCVITVGNIKSDFNTAGFTYKITQLSTIDFHSSYIRVAYSEYPGVRMNGVLKKLTEIFNSGTKLNITPGPKLKLVIPEEASETISHNWLWPALSPWLKPKDIVVTETGTANFGIMSTNFPEHVIAINQYLWGSIGYATPAAQGVAIAAREMGLGRTILWTGGKN
jgi:pyruvate decarboxylase